MGTGEEGDKRKGDKEKGRRQAEGKATRGRKGDKKKGRRPREGSARRPAADRSAAVPLYLDSERESLLCELRLPCSATESTWIQAGVALFLGEGS